MIIAQCFVSTHSSLARFISPFTAPAHALSSPCACTCPSGPCALLYLSPVTGKHHTASCHVSVDAALELIPAGDSACCCLDCIARPPQTGKTHMAVLTQPQAGEHAHVSISGSGALPARHGDVEVCAQFTYGIVFCAFCHCTGLLSQG